MGRDPCFKCVICGKFIAYKDIGTDKISDEFTPDTDFTTEAYEIWHKECEIKQEGKNEYLSKIS